jgi:hypothetical protein
MPFSRPEVWTERWWSAGPTGRSSGRALGQPEPGPLDGRPNPIGGARHPGDPALPAGVVVVTICSIVRRGTPKWVSLSFSDERVQVVISVPITAIPATPPSSRLILVAAEAFPARSTGTRVITTIVTGV